MQHFCNGAPNCNVLLPTGVSRCALHTLPADKGWSHDTTRLRGRKLQRKREALLAREYQCRTCGKVLTLDTLIRDHIIPLAEGGSDEDSNIQPLCASCSDAKTAEESKRGIKRGYSPTGGR
jgi:5-methylcytosine-specific restriction protein A